MRSLRHLSQAPGPACAEHRPCAIFGHPVFVYPLLFFMEPFSRTTEGIRISVRPFYLIGQSDPALGRYVFVYHVRIENQGPLPAQLLWRHWRIHDRTGGDQEIEGAGVVGETPLVETGGLYEYESFCVLEGPSGSMEGSYQFSRPDGSRFSAAIPRFLLRVYEA